MAPHGEHKGLLGGDDAPGARGDGKGNIKRVIVLMTNSQADCECHVMRGEVSSSLLTSPCERWLSVPSRGVLEMAALSPAR
jgi:hypothetical protein